MTRIVKLLIGLAIAIQFHILVPGAWGQEADGIKVGCLYPLTGPGGRYGRDSVAAIRLAEDRLKAEGYPDISFSVRDTRSKSLRAIQIARSFIEKDNVDFLCGVVSSGVALAVTEVARTKGVFFIGTDHASPRLVEEALHSYYFRVNNGTRQSMWAGARYIAENHAVSGELRVAFIGPDYDYGYQAWDDLKRFLHANRIRFKPVAELWPKLFEDDYSIYIHALMESRPDIVVNGHWGPDLVTFVKQAKSLGLFETTEFMNFDAGGNYEVLAELGSEMPLGLVLSARHHNNWPDTAENSRFVDAFRQRYGRYPSYAAQGAYAGVLAIAEAVRQAGGVANKSRLKSALENLRLKLPEDPDGYHSYMDPLRHQMMQVQAIGKTRPDDRFLPARVMLGDWSVYYPADHWPSLPPQ